LIVSRCSRRGSEKSGFCASRSDWAIRLRSLSNLRSCRSDSLMTARRARSVRQSRTGQPLDVQNCPMEVQEARGAAQGPYQTSMATVSRLPRGRFRRASRAALYQRPRPSISFRPAGTFFHGLRPPAIETPAGSVSRCIDAPARTARRRTLVLHASQTCRKRYPIMPMLFRRSR